MSIGMALKKFRENAGYTQEQVAKHANIKRTTYVSYENSKTVPGYDIIEKIVSLFGITMQDFSNEVKHRNLLEISASSPEYKFKVEEKMAELTSEERMVIKYIRILDEQERADFFNNIKNDYLDRQCGDETE